MSVDLKSLSPANPGWLERFLQDLRTPDASPLDLGFVEVFAEGTPASRLIVLLPGSYIKVPYMADFAHGLSQKLPAVRVIGVDYPSRRAEYTVEQIDQFHLVDYVRWVMKHLADAAQGYTVTLVGHSLGTIMAQMVLLAYADQTPSAYKIDSVVILGGGTPKPTWRDYLETLPKLNALWTVMQMVNDPKAFAFDKKMGGTLDGEGRWDDLHSRRLIYPESRAIMRETFTGRDYTYIPRDLLHSLGVKQLMIGSDRDLFVSKGAVERAGAQWGGELRILPFEHTNLVMGVTGVDVGALVADWLTAAVKT